MADIGAVEQSKEFTRTELFGVSRVVHEQNLVAVAAAGALSVLELSGVTSCARSNQETAVNRLALMPDIARARQDKTETATANTPSCGTGSVSSWDWSKAGGSSTAPPVLA